MFAGPVTEADKDTQRDYDCGRAFPDRECRRRRADPKPVAPRQKRSVVEEIVDEEIVDELDKPRIEPVIFLRQNPLTSELKLKMTKDGLEMQFWAFDHRDQRDQIVD